jgi:hypothetical protein
MQQITSLLCTTAIPLMRHRSCRAPTRYLSLDSVIPSMLENPLSLHKFKTTFHIDQATPSFRLQSIPFSRLFSMILSLSLW